VRQLWASMKEGEENDLSLSISKGTKGIIQTFLRPGLRYQSWVPAHGTEVGPSLEPLKSRDIVCSKGVFLCSWIFIIGQTQFKKLTLLEATLICGY
jgi:hypothetical protein